MQPRHESLGSRLGEDIAEILTLSQRLSVQVEEGARRRPTPLASLRPSSSQRARVEPSHARSGDRSTRRRDRAGSRSASDRSPRASDREHVALDRVQRGHVGHPGLVQPHDPELLRDVICDRVCGRGRPESVEEAMRLGRRHATRQAHLPRRRSACGTSAPLQRLERPGEVAGRRKKDQRIISTVEQAAEKLLRTGRSDLALDGSRRRARSAESELALALEEDGQEPRPDSAPRPSRRASERTGGRGAPAMVQNLMPTSCHTCAPEFGMTALPPSLSVVVPRPIPGGRSRPASTGYRDSSKRAAVN